MAPVQSFFRLILVPDDAIIGSGCVRKLTFSVAVKFEDDNVFSGVLVVGDAGVRHLRHVVHRRHDAHRHVVVAALGQGAVVQIPAVGSTVTDNEFLIGIEPLCRNEPRLKHSCPNLNG